MFKRLKERLRRLIYDEAKRAMEQVMLEESFNIERQIQRLAMQDSARFVIENIELHKVQFDRLTLLDHCLKLIPADGLVLEFGVYTGTTIRFMAERLRGRRVYGFDSFEGLHEPWMHHREGAFKVDRLPAVPENVTLVKGLFQDTSARFLAEHPGDIAFLHIDSDLYSSCKYIFDTYGHRIVAGTVVLFDEFFNYPCWTGGEAKAFDEWREAAGVDYEFVGFTARRGPAGPTDVASGQQAAVRILARGAAGPQPAAAAAAAGNRT
jgi:predicted O-methyltransferase YrrM